MDNAMEFWTHFLWDAGVMMTMTQMIVARKKIFWNRLNNELAEFHHTSDIRMQSIETKMFCTNRKYVAAVPSHCLLMCLVFVRFVQFDAKNELAAFTIEEDKITQIRAMLTLNRVQHQKRKKTPPKKKQVEGIGGRKFGCKWTNCLSIKLTNPVCIVDANSNHNTGTKNQR